MPCPTQPYPKPSLPQQGPTQVCSALPPPNPKPSPAHFCPAPALWVPPPPEPNKNPKTWLSPLQPFSSSQIPGMSVPIQSPVLDSRILHPTCILPPGYSGAIAVFPKDGPEVKIELAITCEVQSTSPAHGPSYLLPPYLRCTQWGSIYRLVSFIL